jgi:hypothetical protein
VTSYKPEFIELTEQLSDELDMLATKGSPERIAAYLLAQNAKGKCSASRACPVYNVLARATSGKVVFKVTTNATHIWPDTGERVSLPNPLPVADFISAFDHHRFPELERKS